MRSEPYSIRGIGDVCHRYDAFLFDQWGVIHDGVRVYEGVVDLLHQLRSRGLPVIIVTNSSKTATANRDRLARRFGIENTMYSDLISSVDLLGSYLSSGGFCSSGITGRRVFIVADYVDTKGLASYDVIPVDDVGESDCIVLLSVDPKQSAAIHEAWIDEGTRAGKPMVTVSSDMRTVTVDGTFIGLRSVVETYQARGGIVLNVGKPEKYIYERCKQVLRGIPVDRILAVGDQACSDIVGGNRHGLDTCLVKTGAFSDSKPSSSLDFLEVPKWILSSLCW